MAEPQGGVPQGITALSRWGSVIIRRLRDPQKGKCRGGSSNFSKANKCYFKLDLVSHSVRANAWINTPYLILD